MVSLVDGFRIGIIIDDVTDAMQKGIYNKY